MKYVEIKEGFSVKKEDIIAIEKMGEYLSNLHMNNGQIYETNFPYLTMLQLLEIQEEKEETKDINKYEGFLAS